MPSVPASVPGRAAAEYQGRWATFRRLAEYYVNCLEYSEMPNLRAYINKQDDSWIQVHSTLPWDRLQNMGDVLLPGPSQHQAAFQKNLLKQQKDQTVFLGYPVELVETKEGNRWLLPIFNLPVKCSDDGSQLRVSPAGRVVLNLAWVESRFRDAEERDDLMRFVGMLPQKDDEEGASAKPLEFNLGHGARRIATFCGDIIQESVSPMQLTTGQDWGHCTPGIYNAAAITLGERFKYTKGLMGELRTIAKSFTDDQLDATALAQVFPHDPPSTPAVYQAPETPLSDDLIVGLNPLNQEQERAVLTGLSHPIGAITGPPGTGKSAVVRSLLLNQAIRGRSVLFASKNHSALDAVEVPLNQLSGNGPILIRTAQKDRANSQDLATVIKSLLNKPFNDGDGRFIGLRDQLAADLAERNRLRADLAQVIDAKHLSEQLDGTSVEARAELPLFLREGANHDQFRRLIEKTASKVIETGPDVAQWPFWRRLLALIFRPGLLARHKALLAEAGPIMSTCSLEADSQWKSAGHMKQLIEAERELERHTATLRSLPPRMQLQERITELTAKARESLKGIVDAFAAGEVADIDPAQRQRLSGMRAAMQNFGNTKMQREFTEHADLVLTLFPLFATTNLSARSTTPLVPGAFDLLVVDEASQCDIASTIPLLARARRALVVGDPMQLQHVCNLDGSTERNLLVTHGLVDTDIQRFSYRVNSLFDCVRSALPSDSYVGLVEHFRCHPDIADYASDAFYNGRLRVRTDPQQLTLKCQGELGMVWQHVDGPVEAGRGNRGAQSPAEREAILQAIKELHANDYDGSIGVVTPFRAQASALKDLLEKQLSQRFIERSKLTVDTAHGFQGDERDIMFLSLCGGPGMPRGAQWLIGKEGNLFNVAVTRARSALRIFGNMNWARNCGVSFIEQCVARIERRGESTPQSGDPRFDSEWERRLYEALKAAGIETKTQYPVSGRRLDLALLDPIKIDIEVDGEAYHRTASGSRKDDDIWRDEQIAACGWKIIRFWVYELRDDMDACVATVRQALTKDSR